METIRVLNVVTKMDAAGIETLLMNFYRNIDRTKIQFDFLTHRSEKGFYDDEILGLGGKIFHIPPINPLKHKEYLSALDEFFNNHKEYKIVHSHINTYSMYPLRAAMKVGVPVRIAHSHISNVPLDLKTPFRIYTKKNLKKYSTNNFACSEMAGKWLFGSEAVGRENFKKIINSIDASKYIYDEETRSRIRSQMGLEGKFVIGHIGRFNKQKNHKFLIDVFKEIYKINPNSILMLVGEGELQSSSIKDVEDLGLKENVIFTGVRSDIHELLQAMDVFVFPSLYEGLGIVAVEAQAAGLHCVVSDTIPKEAFITNLIKSISLKSSVMSWAGEILKYNNHYKRSNTYNQIFSNDYDIKKTVLLLEDFYFKNSKE
ncbi:glycosyltransferase family 1 protein [Peribacillus psychrosaccharolyticus]|uniref:glycosyltransferase family 1 protein n=1 Tax=Peribacillus psychrosaccharolyticus TaxID=1407 RepID=UPI003D2C3748